MMAMADYILCDVCGCKAIYDGECWARKEGWQGGVGELVALCSRCQDTHTVTVERKDATLPTPQDRAPTESVGDAFPHEQARVRELLVTYRSIGPAGTFGAMMLEQVLREADAAMASGDVIAILRAYTKMTECQ